VGHKVEITKKKDALYRAMAPSHSHKETGMNFDWKAILKHLAAKVNLPQNVIDDATQVGYDLEQLAVDLVEDGVNYVLAKIELMKGNSPVPAKK
jgi:hypothetical protein